MDFINWLTSEQWDNPFYKRLSKNDTAEAPGHQSGIVFPKDLREYLPSLDVALTLEALPTVDRQLYAELFLGSVKIHAGLVRYQYQTWGGKRTPESRITDFSPLWKLSSEDDIMIFQRSIDSIDKYRIILITQYSKEYDIVDALIGEKRWGVLIQGNLPITQSELEDEKAHLDQILASPFEAINTEITRQQTRQSVVARSTLFREQVCREYEYTCVISGYRICAPPERNPLYEVQAAHIIPVSVGGADDIRNGIPLTHTLHWAFDQGLIGIEPETRLVFVPPRVLNDTRNYFLRQFNGRQIREASNEEHRAHNDALKWHKENVVSRWA